MKNNNAEWVKTYNLALHAVLSRETHYTAQQAANIACETANISWGLYQHEVSETVQTVAAPSKSFEETWSTMEAMGYEYGNEALEQVRFGWELANHKKPNSESINILVSGISQLNEKIIALQIMHEISVKERNEFWTKLTNLRAASGAILRLLQGTGYVTVAESNSFRDEIEKSK